MTRTPDGTVIYAYGIVRHGFDVASAPSGLEDAPVAFAHAEGDIGALVSRLPLGTYGPAEIERDSAEVSWLSPRAMAHDRVLTWAQEHGGVIPLPMFSLFGSGAALTHSLAQRRGELEQVFQRVAGADEFGVRIHRRDDLMLKAIDTLDPDMARLRAEANAASPGQRYLIERKFAEQGKLAVRAASQRLARATFDELRALSRDAIARPLVPDPGRAAEATLVLNGAFLVDRRRIDAFRAAVAASVAQHEARGLTFDFTGPWPPYNFVGGSDAPGQTPR